MFKTFFQAYKNYVLSCRKNLSAEDSKQFDLLNSRLSKDFGFIPSTGFERFVYSIGFMFVIMFSVLLAFLFFVPVIFYLQSTTSQFNLLSVFIAFWFLILFILLMVLFLGFFGSLFVVKLSFLSAFFSGQNPRIIFALKFAWFYFNVMIFEFLKHVLNWNFLIWVIVLIVVQAIITVLLLLFESFLS